MKANIHLIIAFIMLIISTVCQAQSSNTKSAKTIYTPLAGNGYSVEIAFEYQFFCENSQTKLKLVLKEEKALSYRFYSKTYYESDMKEFGGLHYPEYIRKGELQIKAVLKKNASDNSNVSLLVPIDSVITLPLSCAGNINDWFLSDCVAGNVRYVDNFIENKLTVRHYSLNVEKHKNNFSEEDCVKLLIQYLQAKSETEEERLLREAVYSCNYFHTTKKSVEEYKRFVNMSSVEQWHYEVKNRTVETSIDNSVKRKREAQQSDVECLEKFNEGLILYENENYTAALQTFAAVARRKNDFTATAYHRIGKLYEEGRGVEKNLEEALKYYKLAMSKDAFQYYANDYVRLDAALAGISDQKQINKRLDQYKGHYFLGFSGDTRAFLGVSFGSLEPQKLGFYMSIRLNTHLFTKEADINNSNAYVISVLETKMNNGSISSDYEKVQNYNQYSVSANSRYYGVYAKQETYCKFGETIHPAGNVSIGLTKRIFYPLWLYASVNVAYEGANRVKVYEKEQIYRPLPYNATDIYVSGSNDLYGNRIMELYRETYKAPYYVDIKTNDNHFIFGLDAGAIYKLGHFYLTAGVRTHFSTEQTFISFGGGYVF